MPSKDPKHPDYVPTRFFKKQTTLPARPNLARLSSAPECETQQRDLIDAGSSRVERIRRMSAAGGLQQTTDEAKGFRRKETETDFEDEPDGPVEDFMQFLEKDINNATKSEVKLNAKQKRKFFRNVTISFVGQTENKELSAKTIQSTSKKKSVFYNRTRGNAMFTFWKRANDTTTAQLTTRSGFKIGVAAVVGGGVGGQGSLGVGGEYSRGKERMEQTSRTSGREMRVEVEVPAGKSVKAVETDMSFECNAECEFDIAIPDSFDIEYCKSGGFGNCKIRAKELKNSDDPDDDEYTPGEAVNLTENKKKLVHLRRILKCKLVTIEHQLTIEPNPMPSKYAPRPSQNIRKYGPRPTYIRGEDLPY